MGSSTVYQDLLRGRLPLPEHSLQTLCLNNNDLDLSHGLSSSIYKAFSYPSSLLFQITHSLSYFSPLFGELVSWGGNASATKHSEPGSWGRWQKPTDTVGLSVAAANRAPVISVVSSQVPLSSSQ